MKKLFSLLLLGLLLGATVTSCSKEDKELIAGTVVDAADVMTDGE